LTLTTSRHNLLHLCLHIQPTGDPATDKLLKALCKLCTYKIITYRHSVRWVHHSPAQTPVKDHEGTTPEISCGVEAWMSRKTSDLGRPMASVWCGLPASLGARTSAPRRMGCSGRHSKLKFLVAVGFLSCRPTSPE
jgi:hypothetical protein